MSNVVINHRPEYRLTAPGSSVAHTVHEYTVSDYESALDWARERETKLSSVKDATDWHGGEEFTADRYAEMLRHGWKEGLTDAQKLDGLCSDESERLTFAPGVGGAFANIPRYLSGHPEAMYNPVRRNVEHARSVTLVIDVSFHAGITGKTCLDYAQTVMALIAWLAAEQIDTAVYLVNRSILKGRSVIYTTCARAMGDVLQPERIATFVHPCWHRRAWFALLEYEADVRKYNYAIEAVHNWGGYGTPDQVPEGLLPKLFPDTQAVIALPKPGYGDPTKTVETALNLKFKRED